MSKQKIVFFDIDGTIWDWDRNIPESTVKAIKQLQSNGHLAFICSGRAKSHIIDPKLLSIGFDGMVAGCGTYIEINGKTAFNHLIPDEVVRLTVETALKCNMPIVLEGPWKHWLTKFGFENDHFVDTMVKEMGANAIFFDSYTEDMKINKFASDVLRKTDYETVKKILLPYYDFIEHGLSQDLTEGDENDPDAIISIIETVPCGITKGTGVLKACELTGVDISDSFGLGDSANDIEMFDAVGHSICMGNGAEAAKAAADFVTTDLLDDGIANALKHFELI